MNNYSSLEDALVGTDAPEQIRASLAIIDIVHVSHDGSEHIGQLVIHQDLANEVKEIFEALHTMRFPIHKMVPVVAYGWDDESSMEDNNTSAFNYRMILATNTLSNHSCGRAIDINPLQNPSFAIDGNVYPAGAVYVPEVPGTITQGDGVVQIFKKYGWDWLGERKDLPDYQHFHKL